MNTLRPAAVAELKKSPETDPYPHTFDVSISLEKYINKYRYLKEGEMLEHEKLRSPNELGETPNRNLIQTETTTPELEFFKNVIDTCTPCNRKYLGLRRTRPSSKK
uniref:Uncharacterized protein n=1 Tax=Glossina pallidipes TaxID=7398 RepID=A0A1A9ZDV2_GLOPL